MSMMQGMAMPMDAASSPADADESPVALAEAVDATLDAVSMALDMGDVPQAQALLTAAEATSDVLLAVLGGSDPDD